MPLRTLPAALVARVDRALVDRASDAAQAEAWRRLAGLACEIVAFGVAGTLGFLTHAAVLTVLVRGLNVPAYPAWFPAFLVAVTVTYTVNRGWTFRARAGSDRAREYARYALLQSGGAALNNATYAVALWANPWFRDHLVAALALGCLAGMVANYLSARHLAFTGDPATVLARGTGVPRRLRA
jgi:putative flippase GtrA